MSTRYPGGIITKNYVAPTPSSASGIWTLDQQEQAQQAGIWPFGGPFNYIEDVFSTWLYTGNGSTQTITNGIDLSTKGGLVWTKLRTDAFNHVLIDTVRGGTGACVLNSNTTGAASSGNQTNLITPFNSNGYTIATDWAELNSGTAGRNYASWTFRKQPKFFDIVTYTGNNTSQTISHNLGSVPGCIIVKGTSGSGRNWAVWHRSLGSNNDYLWLESTAAKASSSSYWNNTAPTSTGFTVGGAGNTNGGSETYVAYLFAHDAGGFGTTNTDNVISCGSFTVSAGGTASVNLGYEPQWVMVKASSRVLDWTIQDTMRGMYGTTGISPLDLYPNLSSAEANGNQAPINATGFTWSGYANETFIYIAIRRGPMKVPTTGTSVYDAQYAYSSPNTYRSTLTVDTAIQSSLDSALNHEMYTRLTGTNYLVTNDTAAQVSNASARFDTQTGFNTGVSTPPQYFAHLFRRAPSFHDVVCYTGTGSATTFSHNLAAVPELIFTKRRDNGAFAGRVYHKDLGPNYWLYLFYNVGDAVQGPSSSVWNGTNPTASVFSVGTDGGTNASGSATIAYLFATCAGVSKVGSYTGTGTTQTINCGFTAGSRFIMIKRTDSTGDWYVWDSERGIVSGNDPYLLLNTTAAQVTGTDYVDTAATGFEISSTAPAAINANGGTFIFLAIA